MRKIYLILAVALIAVTLIGCSNNVIEGRNEYSTKVTSESLTELDSAPQTEKSSFSAGSDLILDTSCDSETIAETETVTDAEKEFHTVVTEPQTEDTETTPPATETTSKEPTTEKAEETTVYPETTGETVKQEETTPPETTRETEPSHTTTPEDTKQQAEPTETTTETSASEPTPEPVNTPFDAPFDIEQIKTELIALGESMGMTHRTAYKDGTVITPDNSSWELPITANSSFCGEMLKRSLRDYVLSYAEYYLYGGEPITHFTIYVLPLSDGYEIYFLH
ncbi:MAG: hypothetical protein IKT70_03475 [Clostridia bacterium]|nr:hypothetical protein [Clostridia bacterium]